jgi:hypothetical protein
VHWPESDATVTINGRFYQDPTTKKLLVEKKDVTIILKEVCDAIPCEFKLTVLFSLILGRTCKKKIHHLIYQIKEGNRYFGQKRY